MKIGIHSKGRETNLVTRCTHVTLTFFCSSRYKYAQSAGSFNTDVAKRTSKHMKGSSYHHQSSKHFLGVFQHCLGTMSERIKQRAGGRRRRRRKRGDEEGDFSRKLAYSVHCIYTLHATLHGNKSSGDSENKVTSMSNPSDSFVCLC